MFSVGISDIGHSYKYFYAIFLLYMYIPKSSVTSVIIVDVNIVSAATCRDGHDSKWRLLLVENELSRVSLLSRISIGNELSQLFS